MQTIVIGHKNPDMDSICSAIAYAELKRKLGAPDVIAARAGNTNERIDLVLQKFGVPAPEFLSDVSATVADVMETEVISLAHDSSIYQAMNSIEKKRIRGLPVVDADNRCLGLLSGWNVNQYLFPHREEAPTSREIFGSITDIVHSFDGEFVAGGPDDTRKKVTLMVAAMSQASFGERLRSNHAQEVILFVGDREEIQLDAINARVLAVVITGGMGVSAKVRAAAKDAGVHLLSSRYDTATTVFLARGAARIDAMIEPQFTNLSPETPLSSARHVLAGSSDYEEDGHVFSVSQIEELGFSHFYEKQKELFEALEAYRSKQANYFAALLVTDVNTQNSLLLISAPPEFLATITYPNRAANLFELNNVVSRKKQLVPYLLDCLPKINASIS
jgi:manganese-dependent inorganic pyrophosphatase